MHRSVSPAWAWLFALACLIIPLVTAGGTIPLAIGSGGAAACIAIARDSSRDRGIRVALCASITLFCWALFVGLLLGLAGLEPPL